MARPLIRTVPALLARAENQFPDQDALVDQDVRWTFAQLAGEVRRCAAAMIASGLAPGDRVSVWAPNGHRFVVAALGAVSAGAVLVPINTRYKGDEAVWILGKSRARLLLVEEGFLGNDYLAMLRAAAAAAAECPDASGGPVPGLPDLGEVVTLGPSTDPGASTFGDFLSRGGHVPAAQVLARAEAVTEDDLSDMFFTSGTTAGRKAP